MIRLAGSDPKDCLACLQEIRMTHGFFKECMSHRNERLNREAEAEERLHEAAPDLLISAKELLETILHPEGRALGAAITALEAAIAKAEGRE